ncbi:MAG: NAD(P)/FAD-dependent oxidoreductase, partial [Cyanobacteria bacterium P01_H01_bin.58]
IAVAMVVDYDLVILGGTPEGYEAAQYATQLGARVALILQGLDGQRSPVQTQGMIWQALRPERIDAPESDRDTVWQYAVQRATLIADTFTRDTSPHLLIQGVDVIPEPGQIVGDRPLKVSTPSRQLTTRGILLATGSLPAAPEMPDLATIPYQTPEEFLRRETLPSSVVILGSDPLGLILSQILCRWGITVTLIMPQSILLNREDPQVSQWITAQLRAEGARLLLETAIKTVTSTDAGQIELHLPEATVTAETLVVAQPPMPHLSGMNLEERLGSSSLQVNRYLQTSHPRIYACGAVMGGYRLPAIARQEARIAVNNALFWNRQAINYCTLPYHLSTEPEMARVGLTEPQAQQRYGASSVLVGYQPLYDMPKAHWQESTIGFCKLIAHRNGQILGGHGVGPEATEWMQALAMLMKQKVPCWKIASFPTLPDSLTDILRQTTQQWERDRWLPGQWRRDWAENWFNWRRNA